MNILGINSNFEHPAVALIIDGELVFAIEDERITGIKHGRSYTPYKSYIPYDSIYAALKSQNMEASELDEIAYSYDSKLHLKSLFGCFTGTRNSSFQEEIAAYRSVRQIKKALSQSYEVPSRYVDLISPGSLGDVKYTEWNHHLSHASSAFFYSAFDKSLVVVSDGSGENACTSIYLGEGSKLVKIGEILLPHSLGFFYSYMTKHLGFEPFSDEYKVMGLAAYGKPKFEKEMAAILAIKDDGQYKVDIKLLKNLEGLLGPSRLYGGQLEQVHSDLAYSIQRRLEEVIEHVVLYYMKKTGMKSLCLAGGTFLNVLVNQRLGALNEVEHIFIQPGSHDAGTALGAATLSHIKRGGNHKIKYDSMFLGTGYSDSEIESILKQSNIDYEKLPEEEKADRLGDLLDKENVVALFRGRMEFGPRSLGHRSLLASPKSSRTREKLNIIKDREMFRPLAPLVTEEAFDQYFEGIPNRYMMMTVNVKKSKRDEIPAIVHADGTARAQVVRQVDDSFLHSVLEIFAKKAGVPILINTSFNVRGKPIVATPHDALSAFYTSGIDYLLMESYLIKHPSSRNIRNGFRS